jgi:nicotinate phosphoribosyltransferase
MPQPQFSPVLLTGLYELTMLQAHFEEQMGEGAVFSLFVRRLPERRNDLIACGLDDDWRFSRRSASTRRRSSILIHSGAQLVETFVMNQVHLQTVLASKAACPVEAAGGRQVVDFGLRRMHGSDAGLKSARAFHMSGGAIDSSRQCLRRAIYRIRAS